MQVKTNKIFFFYFWDPTRVDLGMTYLHDGKS